MAEITYANSFLEEAEKLLRECITRNSASLPFSKPFENFSVVIGETNKTKLAMLSIPDDLRFIIGNRKVYIVT